MTPSVTHVSGTVTGDVEVRFTESGVAVCRFRLTDTPTQWNAAAQKWRDGTPIRYVCTAWRTLARNAAESLANGVNVQVRGRITEIRDNAVYLSADDIGISLRQRIVYTETSLPSPAAAAPLSPASRSSSRPATRRPDSPPAWWEEQRSSGWSGNTPPPQPPTALPFTSATDRPLPPPAARHPARHRFACQCRALRDRAAAPAARHPCAGRALPARPAVRRPASGQPFALLQAQPLSAPGKVHAAVDETERTPPWLRTSNSSKPSSPATLRTPTTPRCSRTPPTHA
ncbi:single-stranded DNA-binding protein [Streptomyces sp. NPDC048376]|uniref:single-stranded DNA-binding protein n=1 Tax=Streptomyces sp. NPDC048376 TaxID=3154926 RepID=UPI003425D218